MPGRTPARRQAQACMRRCCLSWGADPGGGLNSESKTRASHVSGPELRPWLARWCDSREKESTPELPVQTGKWLAACWCLIVCSCWFFSLTTKKKPFSFNPKSYVMFCRHLRLSQSEAHVFPQYPYARTYLGMVVCKWHTAIQPSPWPRWRVDRSRLVS